MTASISPSIGDPYPEYVDDEFGYAYHAWEVISARESKRLQKILHLDELSPREQSQAMAPLSDLERWALARKALRQDQPLLYLELVDPIAQGDMTNPALHYAEILVDLARHHLLQGQEDTCDAILEKMKAQWPDFEDVVFDIIKARLTLQDGRHDEAHDALNTHLGRSEELGDDIDLHFELAEDFLNAQSPYHAQIWSQRTRQLAQRDGDDATLVDLDLLDQRLEDLRDPSEEADLSEA